MTCPDCHPDAFKQELVACYGEPVVVNGCALYADATMPKNYVLDPAAWSRALCPIHSSPVPAPEASMQNESPIRSV